MVHFALICERAGLDTVYWVGVKDAVTETFATNRAYIVRRLEVPQMDKGLLDLGENARFLGTVQKAQVAAAYAKLFEGSNIGADQAQNLRRQTEATLAPLGRVLGYEMIREEQFTPSLTRLVYILRLERHPTLWEFYFYRPGNRWFVAEINLSQKFDSLGPKR